MNDAPQWLALGSLLGSLATGVISGLVMAFTAFFRVRRERQAQKFSEQEKILDRQEKQIARLEAQAQEQQQVIGHIHGLHAECRAESAQLRLYLGLLLDCARRQYAAMQKAGIASDPPPEVPEALKARPDDADFLAKTTAQNTRLLAPGP